VSGERIARGDEAERGVDERVVDLPRDQRTLGEVRGQERLPHAAHDAGLQHRADALGDDVDVELRAPCDLLERLAHEPANAILGDFEDAAIDRIARRDRDPNFNQRAHDAISESSR
jgi:hypothetical protein